MTQRQLPHQNAKSLLPPLKLKKHVCLDSLHDLQEAQQVEEILLHCSCYSLYDLEEGP